MRWVEIEGFGLLMVLFLVEFMLKWKLCYYLLCYHNTVVNTSHC